MINHNEKCKNCKLSYGEHQFVGAHCPRKGKGKVNRFTTARFKLK